MCSYEAEMTNELYHIMELGKVGRGEDMENGTFGLTMLQLA